MVVGCLGDVAFSVSDKAVRTVSNAVWSGTSRYSVHNRHGTDALTEFTGLDPDGLKFDIVLSAYLGVNPMKELTTLWGYLRNGTTLGLALGSHGYGKYRWCLTKLSIKMEYYDVQGDLTHAIVSVTLQEYLRR